MDETKIPIQEHLRDLRKCLIRSLIALVVVSCCCYAFSPFFMEVLKRPILQALPIETKLVVLAPYEYFFLELKSSLFFALLLCSPFLFSQIWLFIAPGLYHNEKKFLSYFVILATLFFILGLIFAYYLVFPIIFQFFIETLPSDIVPTYSINIVYGFCITILLSFGLVFQTPLLVILLVLFELINIQSIAASRKYVFVASFIVGAILTPPDPLSQIMLAVPMYCLFELGLFFANFIIKK